MLKLLSVSDDEWSLNKFDNKTSNIEKFLNTKDLDGLELIKCIRSQENIIPQSRVIGIHLTFWPIWLDFWRSDKDELIRQFGDESSYMQYYNAISKDEFIENYRRELINADKAGAQYVVFHVSHVQIEHCYNYKFTYSDEEIIEAFIELLNEILRNINIGTKLLLENHWYPGLTFHKKNLADKLMNEIKYMNKGFVLDIGHLMNTNIDLRSEEEAVNYILRILGNLEETKENIKAIHLNSSLTGQYVKNSINSTVYNPDKSFIDRLLDTFSHVGKIDNHIPFSHPLIKKVIDYTNPEYLVYEFSANTLDILEKAVNTQNAVITSPMV